MSHPTWILPGEYEAYFEQSLEKPVMKQQMWGILRMSRRPLELLQVNEEP